MKCHLPTNFTRWQHKSVQVEGHSGGSKKNRLLPNNATKSFLSLHTKESFRTKNRARQTGWLALYFVRDLNILIDIDIGGRVNTGAVFRGSEQLASVD